jgi:hypothetical protein
VKYLPFLAEVHRLVDPARYLEIGIRNGGSLALSRCRTVGIDPIFNLRAEIDTHLTLFRTTSDEYFSRPDPLAVTQGQPFDLAFIDGMHLFEFALRDFINTERCSRETSVIVFDDMLPRSVDEAARQRHTTAWTGDVYSLLGVFAKYRPELVPILVDTEPTGLLVVVGLDPTNSVLSDNYERIMAEFRHSDPQPVPPELLDRTGVQAPQRVLGAHFWQVLTDQRNDPVAPQFRERLTEQLAADLGPAYAEAPATT